MSECNSLAHKIGAECALCLKDEIKALREKLAADQAKVSALEAEMGYHEAADALRILKACAEAAEVKAQKAHEDFQEAVRLVADLRAKLEAREKALADADDALMKRGIFREEVHVLHEKLAQVKKNADQDRTFWAQEVERERQAAIRAEKERDEALARVKELEARNAFLEKHAEVCEQRGAHAESSAAAMREALISSDDFCVCQDEQGCPIFGKCKCGAADQKKANKKALASDAGKKVLAVVEWAKERHRTGFCLYCTNGQACPVKALDGKKGT